MNRKVKYTEAYCANVAKYSDTHGYEKTAKHFGLKKHQVNYVVGKCGKLPKPKRGKKTQIMEIIPVEPAANDKVLVFVTTSGNIRQVLEQLL